MLLLPSVIPGAAGFASRWSAARGW